MIEILSYYCFSFIIAVFLSSRYSNKNLSNENIGILGYLYNVKGTIGLISLLTVVFILMAESNYNNALGEYRLLFGLYNNNIGADYLYKIITNNFVHADKDHLLENIMLLSVCSVYERRAGGGKFFAVFALSCFISSFSVFFIPHEITSSVGASGGIFGLLAALIIDGKVTYSRMNGRLKINGILHLLNLIMLLILSYLIVKIDSKGNVNHIAHYLGAFSGILFVLITAKLVPPSTIYSQIPKLNYKKRP